MEGKERRKRRKGRRKQTYAWELILATSFHTGKSLLKNKETMILKNLLTKTVLGRHRKISRSIGKAVCHHHGEN